MSHWPFLPIALPLFAGALCLVFNNGQRILSVLATFALIPHALLLLIMTTDGSYLTYALGDWPAPFGIILVADRLSALMLLLTALVASASLVYAITSDTDRRGPYFHALWQFQLLGLNGAFLTGDMFNLFVCFEILLIASYGLLLHGGGRELIRAGLHYVVLNLVGSALFLFALGTLYGLLGTLNMADLAQKLATAPQHDGSLLRTSAMLLFVVFGLKAALLPLYFWLPSSYAQTSLPVAALFALMTKVGVYAVIRVFTLLFGSGQGVTAGVVTPWLLPLALATLVLGSLGALAARDLRRLLAYLVIVSIGTLLAAVGLFDTAGLSAGLVYLIHSTLITAGLFVLAGLIQQQRGSTDLTPAPPVTQPLLLGSLFFAAAISVIGLPPLSGFIAKVAILQAFSDSVYIAWGWGLILLTGLFSLIGLARMGGALFWRCKESGQPANAIAHRTWHSLPALVLIAASPLLVAFAAPLFEFTAATASQLLESKGYISAVLGVVDTNSESP